MMSFDSGRRARRRRTTNATTPERAVAREDANEGATDGASLAHGDEHIRIPTLASRVFLCLHAHLLARRRGARAALTRRAVRNRTTAPIRRKACLEENIDHH
jgi:hypothetical protein